MKPAAGRWNGWPGAIALIAMTACSNRQAASPVAPAMTAAAKKPATAAAAPTPEAATQAVTALAKPTSETRFNSIIEIRDGIFQRAAFKEKFVTGKVSDTTARNLKIRARVDLLNGLYVNGKNSNFTWSDSTISLLGYSSSDLDGIAAGALVNQGGTLTLRNVKINTWGAGSTTVTATGASTLKVHDSRLQAYGGPLPSGYLRHVGPGMLEAPLALNVGGTARATLTMDNSKTYFYNSQLIANGWGVVATDATNGHAYVEINNSKVWAQSTGFGIYAAPGAEIVVRDSEIETVTYSGVIADAGRVRLSNVSAITGNNGFLFHRGAATGHSASGVLLMEGGRIVAQNAAFLAKSANADITIDKAEIVAANGDFLLSMVDDDPYAVRPAGAQVPGIRAAIRNSTVTGNVLHFDSDRSMSVALVNATLNGRVQNAALDIDKHSRWKATADSAVTLSGALGLAQIDANAGITIIVRSGAGFTLRGDHKLASGGRLRIVAD